MLSRISKTTVLFHSIRRSQRGQKIRFDVVFRTRFQIGFTNFPSGELIEMVQYKYFDFIPVLFVALALRGGFQFQFLHLHIFSSLLCVLSVLGDFNPVHHNT
jgi:hypothetical protein